MAKINGKEGYICFDFDPFNEAFGEVCIETTLELETAKEYQYYIKVLLPVSENEKPEGTLLATVKLGGK